MLQAALYQIAAFRVNWDNGRDARCPSGGREDGEWVAGGDASGAAGVRALPPSCGRARTPGAPHGRADVPLPFATDYS